MIIFKQYLNKQIVVPDTQSKLLYTRDLAAFTTCHVNDVLSKQTNQSTYQAGSIKLHLLEGPYDIWHVQCFILVPFLLAETRNNGLLSAEKESLVAMLLYAIILNVLLLQGVKAKEESALGK